MTNIPVKLRPSGIVNQSTFNSSRQFPNNNGIVTNYMGMPSKDGSASNKTDFVLGRRFFIQYREPSSKEELDKLFKNEPSSNSFLAILWSKSCCFH